MVIIAAGPFTSRSGRSDSRSITTPSAPEASIVTANATSITPISGSPVMTTPWPFRPISCSVHRPMKLPTMNTLKWAKLISSRMP